MSTYNAYSIDYVGHWGRTVARLTDAQVQLWREGGAVVVELDEAIAAGM